MSARSRRAPRAPARPTARDVALDVLVRVDEGAFSHVLLPSVLRTAGLGPSDRAFVTSLVYGTLRARGACDFLLARVLDRAIDALEPPVRAGLRLGAFQLLDGVPAHAAVGETVEAVGKVRPRARGFSNAVLRAVAASGPPWPWPEGDDPAALAVRTSHPEWLVRRFVADLGADAARRVLDADNEPPAVTLRVNPRRTTVDALLVELADDGVEATVGSVPGAILVRATGDPLTLPAVADGRATPQDQGSQLVAALVEAKAGERVLDVAAAPGGKATAIAEAMDDDGLVVAADLHAGRTRLVCDAADRLGLRAVQAVVADGRCGPWRAGAFDRVLLDAPCSGLGVLRRRAEARWRVRPEAPAELAALQRDLLRAAADALRPGGVLVYSVCTLAREETVEVDEWLAATRADLIPLPAPEAPWTAVGRGARLLPDAAGTDGMYVLRLRRA